MHMTGDALQLKEKGNECFQSGRISEAVAFYKKAESLAPEEPVYPSNLSAALYELGDYLACFQAISRAVANASTLNDDHAKLLLRLSTRLAKTLSHGSRSGTIDKEAIEQDKTVIEQLKALGMANGPKSETAMAWAQWERTEKEAELVLARAKTARERLAQMPLYKKIVYPTREFYSVGQDEPLSIVDDWGPDAVEQNPLKLESLTAAQRSCLAFLFAGVGDARHVYSSMIGLHRAYSKLGKKKQKDFNAHFTLLDIHPTALARDLVIMLLLDDLVVGGKSQAESEEIKATIMYTFAAAVMPPACYSRFDKTLNYLLETLKSDPTKLPPWIHVVRSAIPGLVESLTYWKTQAPSRSTRITLERHQLKDDSMVEASILGSAPQFAAQVEDMKARERKMWTDGVDKMPEAQIIELGRKFMSPPECPGENDPKKRASWLRNAKGIIVDKSLELYGDTGLRKDAMHFDFEKGFFKLVKTLVPPPTVLEGMKPVKDVWTDYRDIQERGTPRGARQRDILDKANEYIAANWKPNMSLFDIYQEEQKLPSTSLFGGMTNAGEVGYPNLIFNTHAVVQQIQTAAERLGVYTGKQKVNKDCPSYSVVVAFFDGVVEGLKAMKGKIKWEILQGEMCQTLLSMKLGADTVRPAEFPRRFMRIWQSNVPDYTHGTLNSAIYVAPCLDNDPHAGASSNCLLNTGIWKSGEEFCHNFSLLYPGELERYLGFLAKDMVPVFGLITLVPSNQAYPLPLSRLAGRQELYHWLTRILLYTIVPPQPRPDILRPRLPNNLTAFLNVLLHLHSIGYPGHWLSQFLSDVVTDQLYSTAVPYLGKTIIPPSEHGRTTAKRKLHLNPWLPDFELLVSSAYEALPFPVPLPDGHSEDDFHIASMDDMGCYEAKITQWSVSSMMPFLNNGDFVLSLIFKSPGSPETNTLAKRLGDVVEGKVTRKGQIYIQTVVETCDMKSGKIVWRMRRPRFEKMKRDNWTLEPMRSDIQEAAAFRIPASAWYEIPTN